MKKNNSSLKSFYLFGFLFILYLIGICLYYKQQENQHQLGWVLSLLLSNISLAFTYHHINKSSFKQHSKIFIVLSASLILSIVFDAADKKYDQLSIQNVDEVSKIVNSKSPKAQLRYYNDKYLIFEIIDGQKVKFVIKKFDDLFENKKDE